MRLLALAVAVMLAGCGGPAAKPADDGPAPVTNVRTDDGLVVRSDMGALRGRVHDEVNYSLAGVRISVLGSDAFTTTDAEGRYTLLNLSAGPSDIQALASGFHPGRRTVDIAAGQTTTLDLMLLPLQARSGGYQPHAHDFWRGGDTYTLMDASFDPAQPGAFDAETWPVVAQVTGPTTNNTLYRIPLPASEDGHPSIVLPGTKEIQVTLGWDAATQTLPDLGVSYDTPETKMYTAGFRSTHLPGQAPGYTFSIPVDPQWHDNGHALWTDWRFYVNMDNDPVKEGAGYRPAVMMGPIHVQMVLVRGEIVLDPPHHDWWEDNTTITLQSQSGTATVLLGAPRTITLPRETIVPPGTARMRFELQWDGQLLPQAPDLLVAMRTADQNPHTTPISAMRHPDAVESGPGRFVAEFDVDSQWPDPFYATSTTWMWYLYTNESQPNRFFWPDGLTLTLDVTLWKA